MLFPSLHYIYAGRSLKFICTYLMWTLSSTLTWEINAENRSKDDCYSYYYYYHCCFCCYFLWWYLLLGLLVLQTSFSSLYKVRWSVTVKCNSFFLLQSVVLLQSEIVITKCDNFIRKCDRYYKERRLLQCEAEQTQGFSCMFKKNLPPKLFSSQQRFCFALPA